MCFSQTCHEGGRAVKWTTPQCSPSQRGAETEREEFNKETDSGKTGKKAQMTE